MLPDLVLAAGPQAMEEVLLSYGGVLLVVSHDRRCMQTLTDRLFVLEGDGVVRLFDGPYYDVRLCGNFVSWAPTVCVHTVSNGGCSHQVAS